MGVAVTSPFRCHGDNPKQYLESAVAAALKNISPIRDETRVLPGSRPGSLAAFARRN